MGYLDKYNPKHRASESAKGLESAANRAKDAIDTGMNSLRTFIPGLRPEFIGDAERQSNSPIANIRKNFGKRFKKVFYPTEDGGAKNWFLKVNKGDSRLDSAAKMLGNAALLPEAAITDLVESTKQFTISGIDALTFPFGKTDYKLETDLSNFSWQPIEYSGYTSWLGRNLIKNFIGKTIIGVSSNDKIDGQTGIVGAARTAWEGIREGGASVLTLDPFRFVRTIKSTAVNTGLLAINTTASFGQDIGQMITSTTKWAYEGISEYLEVKETEESANLRSELKSLGKKSELARSEKFKQEYERLKIEELQHKIAKKKFKKGLSDFDPDATEKPTIKNIFEDSAANDNSENENNRSAA